MTPKQNYSTAKWEKGAVAGGIWGTCEMSLGSLLHNLRIPMKGYIMTFIAIMLMSGVNIRWRQKGLFYRAGLTSALLKLFSPSHNLVVPAIAITIEGFLMELGARIAGNNPVGYALGGALALTWTLLHKFIRLFMMFGMNIYLLYEKVFKESAEIVGLNGTDPVWGIVAVVILYLVCGAAASLIGSFTGSRLTTEEKSVTYIDRIPTYIQFSNQDKASVFRPSLIWMAAAFTALFTAVAFMHSFPSVIPFLGIYFIFAAVRYRGSVRRLLKPKFLIPVLAIAFLSGVFIYAGENGVFSVQAISGGLAMVFRAALVTVALNGIISEFAHPAILGRIKKRYGDSMNGALATAWKTNQAVSSAVSQTAIRKNPMQAFKSALITADRMLDEVKAEVIIVTGGVDSGKTSFLAAEAERLKKDYSVCGFICRANVYIGRKDDYRLTDLVSGAETDFCKRKTDGGFSFSEEAIAALENKVSSDAEKADYVFIDEAGKLEINGGGWHGLISGLLTRRTILVLAVRDVYVDELLDTFAIRHVKVIKI